MPPRSRPHWIVPATVVFALTGFAMQTSGQQPARADSSLPPALPAISSGTVTLPYGEMRALWEAAQPKPASTPAKAPAPPVAFSVQSARYGIDLGADAGQATGQAVFEVMTFAEGWTAVPLLPAREIRLSGVDPAGTLVTLSEGVYTLLSEGPGRRTVTLRFSVDLPDGAAPRTHALRLSGPSALVNELSVTGVPEGWLPEVQNGARAPAAPPDAHAEKGGGAPLLFHLAADQPLALTIVNAEDRKPAPPPPPSVWQAEAQSLVRYDEGQLVYKTRLRLSTDAGAGLTAELALPAAANVVSVTGEDVDHWRVGKSDADETRRLEIRWKTPDTLRREVMLGYELPQAASDGDWHLVSPQVASGGGHLRGAFYALPTIAGVEFISGADGGPLTVGDAQQLPRWLAGEINGGGFATLSAARPAPADNALTLVRVHRLPLLRTARATIEESRFRTRLVADGALLSEGMMTVRHDGPLTFALTLPKDAQLLSCSINRADALPVDRGEGRIELSIPAGTPGNTTEVDLSYTDHRPALAPVSGQVALSLPEIDLFVQTLLWDLQIPEAYELTALEGNVALAPSASPASAAPPVIHLRKDLLKAERPTAGLFYQKRAVTP